MNWKFALAGLTVLAAGAYLAWAPDTREIGRLAGLGIAAPGALPLAASAGAGSVAPAAAITPPALTAGTSGAPEAQQAQAAALSPQAATALKALNQLRSLPPGDTAIELGRQLEAGITPENAAGYVQALLQTQSPAVERAATAALSRTANSELMRELASAYGTVPAEQRGRILQVLEAASSPEALQGLVGIATTDNSEKRSPVVVSALAGIANIGDMDSVEYLLSQVTPANGDYALMALKRVKSAQGIEMIRAAGTGSKDADNIPADYLPVLLRIANAAGK